MDSSAVDVQQHFVPPSLKSRLEAVDAGKARYIAARAEGLEERIPEMDRAGVGFALVSIPKLATYSATGIAKTVEVVRRCNAELLAEVARYPQRFGAWVALPFPSVRDCVAELTRFDRDALVRGVVIFAVTDHWTVDDPRFDEVYAAIAQRDLTIMVHPADDTVTRLPAFDAWALSASIAPMVETSAAVARLILGGTLDRVSNVDVLVPHLGGVLPYLLQRIADQSGRGDAVNDFAYYLRHRLITDTCSFHPPAFECAVAAFTAARMVLGSDYPYRGSLDRLITDQGLARLSPVDRAAVTAGNAERFGLRGGCEKNRRA